jgi:outer membrane protein TolC
MKVLKLFVTLLLISEILLFANEKNLKYDRYISENKNKEFLYEYKKNDLDSLKLRDSWIAPINLSYSISRSNRLYSQEQQDEIAAIAINQPIFQSGGIYYGIKFANANRLYANYSVDVAKRKMIKDTIALLMQIKQTSFREKKQKLLIENAKINLKQKQEEYLSGRLDSGFLDNAIIQKNSVTQALYDIENIKEKLVSRFSVLSDLDYTKAEIPHLKILRAKDFLDNNIVLKQKEAALKKSRYAKDVYIAKYLPKVNFTAAYNWSKSRAKNFHTETDYYNYGIRVTMPLDINCFRDIESARIDYLKSSVLKEDKVRELQALFQEVMQNIKNLKKKIALSNENKKLYKNLLSDTQELYKAGYKTSYDVALLKNSLEIQNIDTKIYEIDKQLELLRLYEMYVNSGE